MRVALDANVLAAARFSPRRHTDPLISSAFVQFAEPDRRAFAALPRPHVTRDDPLTGRRMTRRFCLAVRRATRYNSG